MKHSEFYGAAVPKVAIDLEDQGLAQYDKDLVKAHLARNYGYFGAIDKTLAGFMILDDEGDDYLLFDLRDPKGPLYFQDHEERECWPKFDSPAVYKKFLAECAKREAKDEDFYKGDLYDEKYRPKKYTSKVTPSSADLLRRYQWLMWFFAQPMSRTTTDQSPQHYGSYGVGTFDHHFKNAAAVDELFEAELPKLATDPHLAIYWLLHSTVRCEDERRAQVLEAAKKLKTPLFVAFKNTFGEMSLQGELEVLPSFRARRSNYALRLAMQSEVPVTGLLRSMQIDHKDESMLKALLLSNNSSDELMPEIEAGLKKLRGKSPGRSYLQAALDKKAGKTSSKHIAPLVKFLGKKGVNSEYVLIALQRMLPLLESDKSLHPTVHEHALTFLKDKPFSIQLLELLAGTAKDTKSKNAYAKRAKAVAAIDGVASGLKQEESRTKSRTARTKLPKAEKLLLARKITTDPAYFDSDDQKWGLDQLLAAKYPERIDELVVGLMKMKRWVCDPFFKSLKLKGPKDPNTELMLRLLEMPEGDAQSNFSTKMDVDNIKEKACHVLSQVATKPAVFDRLMKVMDTPELIIGRHQVSEELIDTRGDYTKFAVQHLLSNKQAAEATKRMIAHSMSGEPEHSLFYVRHKGAEDVLIEALNTVTHEGTVGSLYAAVRNMGTPRSRNAILSRLFVDERDIWRLLNAIQDLFSDKLHKQVMKMLKERPELEAINRYMWCMVDFVKKRDPALDVLQLALDTPAKSKADRALKKMILHEGAKLALERSDDALAGHAWREAEAINEAPHSIYHEVRKQTWKDPFADDDLKKKVTKAAKSLAAAPAEASKASPKKAAANKSSTKKKSSSKQTAPKKKTATKKKSSSKKAASKKAAAKPVKSKKLSAPALAKLAKAPLYTIVLRDEHKALFIDDEKNFHYYDGFALTKPPFDVVGGKQVNLRPMMKKVRAIDERIMFWKGGSQFVEWMRCGKYVFTYSDLNNGQFRNLHNNYGSSWVFGFAHKDEAAAKAMMAAARKNKPSGMKETDPYYLDGKGAVIRAYYNAKLKKTLTGVVGKRRYHDDATYKTEAEALKAFNSWEAKFFKAGGVVGSIEWMKRARKPQDMSVLEYFNDRRRDDSKDVVWHMEFFAEFRAYLKRTKLDKKVKNFSIKIGKGVAKSEITKVEKALKCKVPDALADVWTHFGSISWTAGDESLRLLSPKELLARQAKQAAWNEDAINNKMSDAERKRLSTTFNRLQVLVEDQDGNPVTVWCARNAKKADVFSEVDPKKPTSNLWWARLGWTLCTQLSRDLLSVVADEVGKTEMKKLYRPK